MASLVTVFAPDSVLNSENSTKEMYIEQAHLYDDLYQKIDNYYAMPRTVISRRILDEIIEAYNQRGRLNMKFMKDANTLKNYEFETKINVCSEYIELSKAHNEQLGLIVENLEKAIENECSNSDMAWAQAQTQEF